MGGLLERPLVSSKRWPSGDSFSRAGIHAGCRMSLQRLGVDHLDLCFLHWPDERIPCSRNPAHIGGNSAAAAIELDDAVLAELEAVMQLGPAFA